MIAVILTILKIIGIIVLCLLGLIILLLLLALFVPVRYRVEAHRHMPDDAPVHVVVRFCWLLHILNAAYLYPEEAFLRVRLFCFTLYNSSDPPKESKKNNKNTKDAKEQTVASAKEKKEEEPAWGARIETTGEEKEAAADQNTAKNQATAVKQESEKQEQHIQHKIKDFFSKLIKILRNTKYTMRRICDKIKNIIKQIKYYIELIQSDSFREAVLLCQSQLLVLFRMLRPRKLTAEFQIGTGDPASTGQVMCIYGMLYPFIGNNVSIIPDFESENLIFEGDFYMKGRVTAFTLLRAAWIIYFNKNIRSVINQFKQE